MTKTFNILILIAVSLCSLYYAFYNIDFDILYGRLLKVDSIKFSLSIAILILACIFRSKRLQYIVSSIDDKITLHHLFSSTMIGYFGNGILFFRLGEVLKAYSISQGNKITTSESFGVIMLERMIDALSVLMLLLISLIWLPTQNSTINHWIAAFTIITILFTFSIIVLRKINWEKFIMSFSFVSERIRKTLIEIVKNIFDGIDTIKNTSHVKGILFSTISMWTCYYIMTIWLLESCQIYLIPSGSFIVLVMGAIIIAVPALPGGLGTYEAGITYTLMLFYLLNKDEALTYAIVSHASNYIPFLCLGSIYFIISGLRISDLKKVSNSK